MGHPPWTRYDYEMDLTEVRKYLRRSAWGQFPDVHILTDVAPVKSHPQYSQAKGGDPVAADALIDDVLVPTSIDTLGDVIGNSKPWLLAIHAVEDVGMNAIPRALARRLSRRLDAPIAEGIIQINRVLHTGADGYHRLSFPPVFDGKVEHDKYLVVDDFIGQGGTLTNLKGHVETNGGKVLGAVVLCGKAYSAQLRLSGATLDLLRQKHGPELEEWWIATFGYSFERLTESEARYLERARDADTIRARLASARGTGD